MTVHAVTAEQLSMLQYYLKHEYNISSVLSRLAQEVEQRPESFEFSSLLLQVAFSSTIGQSTVIQASLIISVDPALLMSASSRREPRLSAPLLDCCFSQLASGRSGCSELLETEWAHWASTEFWHFLRKIENFERANLPKPLCTRE